MEAFITGSRAYGTPGAHSDVDLVIMCDEKTQRLLCALSDNPDGPVRFGRLNLIVCSNPDDWKTWKKARGACLAIAPCGRAEAVQIHQQLGVNGAPSRQEDKEVTSGKTERT